MTDLDHYVIPRHAWRPLRDLLDQIPAVLDDLAVTITRQDRIGAGALGSSGDPTIPLPINLAASDAADDLRGELGIWVLHTVRHRALPGPGIADTLTLARWLSRHLVDLAQTPEATLAHDRIQRAIRNCRRACDRPAENEVLIGYCGECRNPVKGKLGQEIQECQTCEIELTEDQVYADIDAGMAQVALTAKEAAHLINLRYGANIKPKTVYDMAYRKTSPIQAVPLADGGVAFWMREIIGDLRTKGKIA